MFSLILETDTIKPKYKQMENAYIYNIVDFA